MNSLKNIFATVGMFTLLAASAWADVGYVSFATGGTSYNSSVTNYAVISDNARMAFGTPTLTYISATSDLAGSKLQFYSSTNKTTEAFATTNSTTTLFVTSTNGFTAGNFVLIEHVPTDTYEFGVVAAVQNTNQIVLGNAPLNPTVSGDAVYLESPTGSVPVGAATISLIGPGIYTGKPGKPLLMTLTGTSADSINAVNAVYQ